MELRTLSQHSKAFYSSTILSSSAKYLSSAIDATLSSKNSLQHFDAHFSSFRFLVAGRILDGLCVGR